MSHDHGHGVYTMTAVILADPTHRQQSGIPGLHQQLLKFTCCSDIFPLRSLVNPLLEAEDMPLHFLPRDALPGHLQGLALCFGALPLTHGFTFQNTGPTSAYPGHYPWPLLLRASSSPVVYGWHLLCEGTSLTEDHWRLLRSQFPWLASVGRCSPPGFCGSAHRSVSKAAGALSCAILAPAPQPLALVGLHGGSPHLCLRCP